MRMLWTRPIFKKWPAIEKEWADWDDLEEHEQEAAGNLGLDEDTWPPKQDLFASEWVQLNAEQQVRAAPSLSPSGAFAPRPI